MSRYYRVAVKVKRGSISPTDLFHVMFDEFGWKENADSDLNEDIVWFEGEGTLCGGQTDEEAHNQIWERLKEINPNISIQTTWTYLEALPSESYGYI